MSLEHFQHYIDGAFTDATETFESVDPSTGKPWAVISSASPDDVDRAVRAADRALNEGEWPSLTASARGRLLYKMGDLIEQHAAELGVLESRDTGKIVRETAGQICYMAQYYRYFGGLADKLEGRHIPIDKPDMDATLRREPIGVVAAVVPWNSQFMLSAVKLGPALAAGCTIVLKASEAAPAPLLALARLFHEAGFPPGVVNVVTGFGESCGKPLTSHPLVARVAFTGGPATARHIVRNTSENLAFTTLELGGKSPIIVCDDADLDSAANAIVAGIFAASGQSCVAGSRLIVHRDVRDALLERLIEKAGAIRIGDPQDDATEMGPLATAAQLKYIEDVVERSVAAGATLLCGGARPAGKADGLYYQPTILDCDYTDSPSAEHELFGPVLSVFSFEDETEAIELANRTKYGMAAGVFTRDIGRAYRLLDKVCAGVVWVNTYRAVSPLMPFGGYGESGLARESGAESILDYTRTKAVWIRTSDEPIPDPFVMR
jgi:aldehyde dehydrogenase (NAD+)/betaine-aldehyde dehydrogenase